MRARIVACLFALVLGGCSLFVALDGLHNPDAGGDAPTAPDAPIEAAGDAATDAFDGFAPCNPQEP